MKGGEIERTFCSIVKYHLRRLFIVLMFCVDRNIL